MKQSARFCVVGSGVAGGIVARGLLDASLGDVVMVEAGDRMLMRDPRIWHDVVMARRSPFKSARIDRTEYDASGGGHYDLTASMLRARGGSTLHWDGWAFRLKPEDFALATHAGLGADWPIGYDDLEAHYASAERTLQVAGEAADPGHPPRLGPFPLPAFPFQESDGAFLRGMDSLGYGVQHTCIARNTAAVNGMPPCQTIGTCIYCPIGGRFTGDQLIDRLEANGELELRTRTTAVRLLLDSKERVRAVELFDQATARSYELEVEYVIVCSNAIYTPALLLSSTSSWWPTGVGNHGDAVGRHLHNHIGVTGVAVQESNPTHSLNELVYIETAMSRHFDTGLEQRTGKFQLQHGLRYESDSRAPSGPLTALMLEGRSSSEIQRELSGHVYRALVAMVEQVPDPDNRVTLGGGSDQVGRARVSIAYDFGQRAHESLARARGRCEEIMAAMRCRLVTWLPPAHYAHHMGTCRMSASPDGGVVDEDLRVHGLQNLYLCGSAVFPSGGAAQPTLTIAALAHRLADHLQSTIGPR